MAAKMMGKKSEILTSFEMHKILASMCHKLSCHVCAQKEMRLPLLCSQMSLGDTNINHFVSHLEREEERKRRRCQPEREREREGERDKERDSDF
jgi:hypothetical protein